MTEPVTTQTESLSLWSRAIGMVTSPKATFEKIVGTPKPFGILFLCAVIIGIASAAPQFTAAGQAAVVEMQAKANPNMSEQQLQGMRTMAPYFGYFTIGAVRVTTSCQSVEVSSQPS